MKRLFITMLWIGLTTIVTGQEIPAGQLTKTEWAPTSGVATAGYHLNLETGFAVSKTDPEPEQRPRRIEQGKASESPGSAYVYSLYALPLKPYPVPSIESEQAAAVVTKSYNGRTVRLSGSDQYVQPESPSTKIVLVDDCHEARFGSPQPRANCGRSQLRGWDRWWRQETAGTPPLIAINLK